MSKIDKIKSYRKNRYCPCCRYKTFEENTYSTCHICPICSWEDEALIETSISESFGPKHVSLAQAQKNFRDFGAMEKGFLEHTREPKDSETCHPNWPWLIEKTD